MSQIQQTFFTVDTPDPFGYYRELLDSECDYCGEAMKLAALNPVSNMCSECHDEQYTDCDSCNTPTPNDDLDSQGRCDGCITRCENCKKKIHDPDDEHTDEAGDTYCDKCYGNRLEVSDDGEFVVSNEHCKVPFRHVEKSAPHLLYLIRTLNGKRWRPNRRDNMKWGEYTVDYIDASGNIHVGCHFFRPSEFERFCRWDLNVKAHEPKKNK